MILNQYKKMINL